MTTIEVEGQSAVRNATPLTPPASTSSHHSPGSVVVVDSTAGGGGASVLAALLSRASSSTVKDMSAQSGLWRKRCQLHMLLQQLALTFYIVVVVVVDCCTHARVNQFADIEAHTQTHTQQQGRTRRGAKSFVTVGGVFKPRVASSTLQVANYEVAL